MRRITFIYDKQKDFWVKANKLNLFWRTIKSYFSRFKIIDTWKYTITPRSDSKYYFKLSSKEYEEAEKIYKEQGTISYEFVPSGIGWGIKVHCLDRDNKVVDITDYSNW